MKKRRITLAVGSVRGITVEPIVWVYRVVPDLHRIEANSRLNIDLELKWCRKVENECRVNVESRSCLKAHRRLAEV